MNTSKRLLLKAVHSVRAITSLLSRDLFCERIARMSLPSVLCVSIHGMDRLALHLGHDLAVRLQWAVCCRIMDILPDPVMHCDRASIYIAVDFPENLATLADQIQKNVLKPYSNQDVEFSLPEGAIYLQTKIGIAGYQDGIWPDDLIRYAGLAAYYAGNHSGDDVSFYDPKREEYDHSTLFLEQALTQAVTQDRLSLYYQPQLDVETGEIIGYEALLRWFHPVLGMVPTLQTISILQRTNQLHQTTIWVLQQVSSVLCRWRQACPGARIQISINLPTTIFISGWKTFYKVLVANAANARNIVLEITESNSVGVDHREVFGERLALTQELGYRVSVDDFGTGFSNFDQLRSFSFNELKLDKTFVRGIPDNDHDCDLVVSMLRYATSRGMVVTAEGVETLAQFEFLKKNGCQKVQGYLISPPISETEAFELLKRQTSAAQEIINSLR